MHVDKDDSKPDIDIHEVQKYLLPFIIDFLEVWKYLSKTITDRWTLLTKEYSKIAHC